MEQYLEKNTTLLKTVYNLDADTDFDVRRDLPTDTSFEILKEHLPVDIKRGDKILEKISDTCDFKANLRKRIELASLRLVKTKMKICRQLAIQSEIWSKFGAKIDVEIEGLKVLGEDAVTSGYIGLGEMKMLTTAMDNADKRIGKIELLEHPAYWDLDQN